MKKVLLLIVFLFTINFYSQEILQPTNEKTYTEYMDKVLENVKTSDATLIKNGILYDRVFPIAKLSKFNKVDSLNTSNYQHFMRSWNELYDASLNPDFLNEQTLRDVSYHFERENKIQIGIINVDFTSIDSTALKTEDPSFEIINQKIQRISKKNPYIVNRVFVASPLKSEKYIGSSFTFEIGKIILQKSVKHIQDLTVYFENNQSFTIVSNGSLVNSEFQVTFSKSGLKEITFDVMFSDNTYLTTYANFFVEVNPKITKRVGVSPIQYITATTPFQGYNEPSNCGGSCFGQGEYKVYLASNHTSIVKPYIVVDGFDPNDTRKIDGEDSIYEMMEFDNTNLVDELNDIGYDVIILSFPKYFLRTQTINFLFLPFTFNIYRDGGADYVERNAKVVEKLITDVNQTLANNNSPNGIIIAGPSMGALVVQYALKEMENNNQDHNVDLYISFDGPHKGANIPIGMQRAIEYFNLSDAKYPLNTPAAKQMLISHYLSGSEGLPAGAPNFRNRFQNELNNIGFPNQCRNIAALNGTLSGIEKSVAGSNMAYVLASAFLGLANGQMWVNYTSNSGNQEVFKFRASTLWGLIGIINKSINSSTSSSYGSLDNSPGGYFNVVQRTEDALNVTFPMWYSHGITSDWGIYGSVPWWAHVLGIIFVDYAYIDIKDDFCFVPSKSAISYSGSNPLWRENIGCRNLVCTGETPFDCYYAPSQNQEHASLHSEGVLWLMDEIQGNYHNVPTPNNNSCFTSNLTILGDKRICYNQTKSYTLSTQCDLGNITWSTSTNLQTISSTNQSITIKSNNSRTGYAWIKATFPNGTFIKKDLIGKPSVRRQNTSDDSEIILEGVGMNINNQDITNVTWTKTGGNGILEGYDNDFYAYGIGTPNHPWTITGYATVTNPCGSTICNFNLVGDGEDPCLPQFQKIAQNKYQVIDPCNPETVQYISESELYSHYGVKIQDLIPEEDKIDINNTTESGTIKIIKAVTNNKTVSKLIIVD